MNYRSLSLTLAALPLAAAACTTPAPASTAAVVQTIAKDACPASVPAAIAPAADQTLAFVLDGVGVQRYRCAATATGYAWSFVAPAADLFLWHENDTVVGTHFAGPTWEYEDGSTVVGKKLAAATVDKTAIPWLLLVATSHGPIDGRMTEVTSVQRLSTVGGLAPATGCAASTVGAISEVPYSASYYFYRTRDANETDNLRCE